MMGPCGHRHADFASVGKCEVTVRAGYCLGLADDQGSADVAGNEFWWLDGC